MLNTPKGLVISFTYYTLDCPIVQNWTPQMTSLSSLRFSYLLQCSEPLHRLLEGAVYRGNSDFLLYPPRLVDQLESNGFGVAAMSLPATVLTTWLWKIIMYECTCHVLVRYMYMYVPLLSVQKWATIQISVHAWVCVYGGCMYMYGSRPSTCTHYLKQLYKFVSIIWINLNDVT